jgi:16S rRNA (guanine527-N7)-methyltransferase
VPSELDPICAELGLAPTEAQTSALSRYLDLLQHWNATYNLTAVRDRAGMLTQHLADSMSIIPPLQRRAAQGRLLDVGSGGGLPGVVIATLLPGWDVTCVDAVAKKTAFVRQVAGRLSLPNLHAVHSRVENLQAPPFDLITSRAFASLANFTALTRQHLAPGGAWLAMKGRVPDDEMTTLPPDVHVFHVEPLHVPGLNAQRCLIWMQPRKPE